MSASGQKRTFSEVRAMSALPPKADIGDPLHSQRASRHGKQAVAVSGTPKSVIIAVSCMVTLAAT
jgi:hypothetical protein